jgi:hypothetical protein
MLCIPVIVIADSGPADHSSERSDDDGGGTTAAWHECELDPKTARSR